jgi:hypothetical protein
MIQNLFSRLLFVAIATSFFLPTFGEAKGGSGGHAGDPATLPFYRTALSLERTFRRIENLPNVQFPKRFSVARFSAAVETTYLISTDEKIFVPVPGSSNGSLRPATFKCEKSGITIQRQEAAHLAETDPRGFVLEVIHEYLCKMKFEDSRFGEWDEHSVSAELLDILEKTDSLSINQHAERLANAREIFRRATRYSEDNSPHMRWNCLEVNALQGVTLDTTSLNAFKTGKGPSDRLGIRATEPIGARDEHYSTAQEYIQSWVEIQTSDEGYRKNVSSYDAFRVTRFGDLIIERGLKKRLPNQISSIAQTEKDSGVLSYFVCPYSQNIQMMTYTNEIESYTQTINDFSDAYRTKKQNSALRKLKKSIDSHEVVFFDDPKDSREPFNPETNPETSLGQKITHTLLMNLRAMDYFARGKVNLDLPSVETSLDNAYAKFYTSTQNEIELLPELVDSPSSSGSSPFERLMKSIRSFHERMVEDALLKFLAP